MPHEPPDRSPASEPGDPPAEKEPQGEEQAKSEAEAETVASASASPEEEATEAQSDPKADDHAVLLPKSIEVDPDLYDSAVITHEEPPEELPSVAGEIHSKGEIDPPPAGFGVPAERVVVEPQVEEELAPEDQPHSGTYTHVDPVPPSDEPELEGEPLELDDASFEEVSDDRTEHNPPPIVARPPVPPPLPPAIPQPVRVRAPSVWSSAAVPEHATNGETASRVVVDDQAPSSIEEAEEAPAVPRLEGAALDYGAGATDPSVPADAVGLPAVPPPDENEPEPRGPTALERAVVEARSADWSVRAESLRRELEAEKDRTRAALVAYELGELLERRLQDESAAVKAFGKALQSDPSLRPNLWAIRRVFYRRNLWPNLVKLIDAETRFARDAQERADLLTEKGRILEDRLNDRAGAAATFDLAIANDPSHQGALYCRERMALVDHDDETLVKLWRQLADSVSTPSRKVGYLLDIARALAGKGDEGIGSALEVVSEAAAIGGTERERVLRERERLSEVARDHETLLAALEARIAIVVERFGPGGVPPAPAEAPDPSAPALDRATRLRHEIVMLRRRQARAAREAGDALRAWSYLEQALAVLPAEPLVFADLADLAESVGQWEQLADFCARLASVESDPARSLALSLRRADALARAGMGDAADAVLDGVVAAAPGYLPVVALRERRALEMGAWDRVAQLLSAEAAAARLGTAFGATTPEPDQAWAASAYLAAGDVFAYRLGREEEARAAYGSALEAVPGYHPAALALAALHERAGHLGDACAVLEAQIERLAADSTAGAALEETLEHLGLLYQEQDRPEDELRALSRLVERRPDDATLGFRLEELLAACGRGEERAQLLERLAERIDDPYRKAATLLEIARIYDEELDQPERAMAAYRRTLEVSPSNRYARGAVTALLRRTSRWEDLVVELKGAAADGEGVRALREAAAILDRQLGRSGEAAALYRELGERAPSDAAVIRSLAQVLQGEPERLAEVLEREIEVLPEGDARAAALVRLGEHYEKMERADKAAASYRRALAEEGGEGGVPAAGLHPAWALVKLASRGQDRTGLAEALAVLSVGREPKLEAALLEEVAWLSTDDPAAATDVFDKVLAVAPERSGAHLGRALMAARRRDNQALAGALIAQAEGSDDTKVSTALYLRAATLAEVAGDRARASELARRALAAQPTDPGALIAMVERLGKLPEDADKDEAILRAQLLERRASLAEDATRLDLDLDRALEYERIGRLADAGRVLGGILYRQPDHLGALQALRRVARRAEDRETLARVSFRLGHILDEPESAAQLLAESATLLDRALGRSDEAAPVWRAVLERAPLFEAAFDRAHEIYTAKGDLPGLADLVSHRLRHLGDPLDEIPYRLERAAICVRLGDHEGAARDLTKILDIDPRHREALHALAQVCLDQNDAQEAASLLERYLRTPGMDDERELATAARKQLAEVLADRLGDLEGAMRALEHVVDDMPDDLEARERLVRVFLAREEFEAAAEELQRLGARRGDRYARAKDELEAARLFRGQLHDAARARRALERARTLDPLALDPVRELVEISEGAEAARVLTGAIVDLRKAIAKEPARLDLFSAFVEVAELSGDAELAFVAGATFVGAGGKGPAAERQGARLRAYSASPLSPRRILTFEDWRMRLAHHASASPLQEAWACLRESVARLTAYEPQHFGFHKKDHVAQKHVPARYPAFTAIAKTFGVTDCELYVSSAKSDFARAVPLERPLLYVSADVVGAESARARFHLAQALAEAREGTGGLDEVAPEDLELCFAAAVKLAGGDPLHVPHLVRAVLSGKVDERLKALSKVIPRKDKKALPQAANRLVEPANLEAWREACRQNALRAGILFSGAVDLAVEETRADGDVSETFLGELLAWAVSDDHVILRKELGL